ncbi:MAG TPA: TrpB-like pyridoxal phosphate-dependent enzyme [Ktedonobacteraceae bacterium]|nr:TrpB-like pyridoxal phosphate-dependent enzyme [Ktedonobacteraceae bacterium]
MREVPRTQFLLSEEDVPRYWYNILADLQFPVPREHRARFDTASDAGEARLMAQIPLSMYRQSISKERFIEIPEPVRDEYRRWRPTPLYRAYRLERLLDTPARIYYKYEGSSPAGSHKLNTALAQVYYYQKAGIRHLTTGTGAGQWGTALAMACQSFGMRCTVYMVRLSYAQKPYRRIIMSLNNAEVISSPSEHTQIGREMLARYPDTNSSLAIANAEAIEHARTNEKCRFSIGSGENHVLLHQTVIGEEALRQMELSGDFPDVVIGCMGAGSNFAGLAFPFYREKIRSKRNTRFLAVEPEACPKMTRGRYTWDYNDFSGITPMTKMYTLGHTFISPGIHAGGLRYHGAAPIVSAMYHRDLIEAVAYPQRTVFEAGIMFAQSEKLIPAPESAHAVRGAIDEALRAREEGRAKVILFNISGHGLMDLAAYEFYLSGQMEDYIVADDVIAQSLARIPAMEGE